MGQYIWMWYMNIAIDYDETYTCDREAWNKVIEIFRERGHNVYIVTMRSLDSWESTEVMHDLDGKVDGIFFTGRKAKKNFMYDLGININVWCDDNPFFVLHDAKG